jgi:peptide/nickel transport system permease protein
MISGKINSLFSEWKEVREYRQQELRRATYAFTRSKLSLVGLGLVIFICLVALFSPILAPYPEDGGATTHTSIRLQAPSPQHWFGTDDVGRDVLSRVILASRLDLGLALSTMAIALAIGVLLGAWSGIAGGMVDEIIMRLTDMFMTIPDIILAMVIIIAIGPGARNAVIALALVWWPGYSRLMRSLVLVLRQEQFVEASIAMGGRQRWIIFKHLIPNTMSPILIRASMDLGFVLLAAAGLGFLGLGAVPPQPEWGMMVSEGRLYFPDSWWLTVFPGSIILLTVFGFNLLGDGLRDIAEPTSRR